jgi:hypothetical protein
MHAAGAVKGSLPWTRAVKSAVRRLKHPGDPCPDPKLPVPESCLTNRWSEAALIRDSAYEDIPRRYGNGAYLRSTSRSGTRHLCRGREKEPGKDSACIKESAKAVIVGVRLMTKVALSPLGATLNPTITPSGGVHCTQSYTFTTYSCVNLIAHERAPAGCTGGNTVMRAFPVSSGTLFCRNKEVA